MGAFAAVARGSHEEPQLITIRYEPRGRRRPAARLRRQGRDVRLRRHLDQARGEDERDEVRHVGRRRGARGDRRDRPARPAGAGRQRDRRDREPAQRPRGQARRHPARQDRHDDRGAQHRRRGPARARRLPRARDRPRAPSGSSTSRRSPARSSPRSATRYAGLFGADDDWVAEVEAAGRRAGELAWRLPLHAEYAELIKSRYADIANAVEARKAGSITAAEFLRRFTGDVPWAHLDIAGTAYENGKPYTPQGRLGLRRAPAGRARAREQRRAGHALTRAAGVQVTIRITATITP